ncbi:MAG TPA: polynucleotide adenylyltransferase PcnB [Anaeromyxobacteraceae bacterium]|nr:polynucleotide adenylyltransferase PcnB [Anaeromyxobacteraceae bacterium]
MEQPENRHSAPPASEQAPLKTSPAPDAARAAPPRHGHPEPRRRSRDRREGSSERPVPHARGLALDPDLPRPEHEPEIAVERLDPDAVKVISRLRHVGHQAYLVGGCVRDLLVGRTPKDFDVATDAHPGEVRAIFRNCRLIGRRFRLAHVYFRGGKIIEVATFRANPIDVAEDVPSDADLLITRDNVFGTAEEDARRRDFTVNGLFYDPFLGEVIDYVGGRHDLEARRIATIGDPEIRMREDPVRALRAIRFAARLGFTVEPEVFAAMRRHAGELARCAPPRVLEEIFKILRCGGAARAFDLLRTAGALPVVLPSLSATLETADPAARARFQAYLAALDALVRTGEEVSEAVLLGALLTHLRHGPGGDGAADALLTQLVQTARLPRRIAERTRLALAAQRQLTGPPRRRRRRGGSVSAQAYFRDALQILEIGVRATGEGADALARWRAEGERRAGGGEPAGPDEDAEEAGGAPSAEGAPAAASGTPAGGDEVREGRRRRRRGGRRRRRRGRGAQGAEARPAGAVGGA